MTCWNISGCRLVALLRSACNGFTCSVRFRFIGEESVAAGEPCVLSDSPTWIIDPIDGTTNFVHA